MGLTKGMKKPSNTNLPFQGLDDIMLQLIDEKITKRHYCCQELGIGSDEQNMGLLVPPLYLSSNFVFQEAWRKIKLMNIPEREILPEIT